MILKMSSLPIASHRTRAGGAEQDSKVPRLSETLRAAEDAPGDSARVDIAGQLKDIELAQERLDTALAELPKVPAGAA